MDIIFANLEIEDPIVHANHATKKIIPRKTFEAILHEPTTKKEAQHARRSIFRYNA